MALSEVFPALTAAQKSIALNPLWWIGYQTLGRAHLGLGEVRTVSFNANKITVDHSIHCLL